MQHFITHDVGILFVFTMYFCLGQYELAGQYLTTMQHSVDGLDDIKLHMSILLANGFEICLCQNRMSLLLIVTEWFYFVFGWLNAHNTGLFSKKAKVHKVNETN